MLCPLSIGLNSSADSQSLCYFSFFVSLGLPQTPSLSPWSFTPISRLLSRPWVHLASALWQVRTAFEVPALAQTGAQDGEADVSAVRRVLEAC